MKFLARLLVVAVVSMFYNKITITHNKLTRTLTEAGAEALRLVVCALT